VFFPSAILLFGKVIGTVMLLLAVIVILGAILLFSVLFGPIGSAAMVGKN